ncbi:MAG: hypothetical protein RR334_03200, partial [Clostridia bacterium]
MKKEFADNLIQLRLTTARLSEGKGEGAGLFTIKYQILFLLEKHGKTAPRIIIHELSLAKSNLAL